MDCWLLRACVMQASKEATFVHPEGFRQDIRDIRKNTAFPVSLLLTDGIIGLVAGIFRFERANRHLWGFRADWAAAASNFTRLNSLSSKDGRWESEDGEQKFHRGVSGFDYVCFVIYYPQVGPRSSAIGFRKVQIVEIYGGNLDNTQTLPHSTMEALLWVMSKWKRLFIKRPMYVEGILETYSYM